MKRRALLTTIGAHGRRQFLQLAALALASLSTPASSWAAEPNVVGNWKLVSLFTKEIATGKTTTPLGEHPKGYLIYTPEGRLVALLVHEKRSPLQVDEDRINLHKYMVAYSGRYTVESEKVVHHVDISWNESWTGTDQVRFFELEGDKLTITAPVDAINGLESTSVLVWERER
jgi:lipocalin-like protein